MRNTVGISPFLVILSVLVGAAAGGFVGALLAVPIAATGEVLIEGLQAREVPVAQDPTSATDHDEDEEDAEGATSAGTAVLRETATTAATPAKASAPRAAAAPD